MSAKHTPGPWVHYDDSSSPVHRHQIAAMGKTIAHVYCTKGHEVQDAANARLISAAPELLEALVELLDGNHPNRQYVLGHPAAARARAAIAKAKGDA